MAGHRTRIVSYKIAQDGEEGKKLRNIATKTTHSIYKKTHNSDNIIPSHRKLHLGMVMGQQKIALAPPSSSFRLRSRSLNSLRRPRRRTPLAPPRNEEPQSPPHALYPQLPPQRPGQRLPH